MRIAIIFISLLVSIQSLGQTQSTLPAGAVPLSSQSYRSPSGDVWIGRDGMYYNVGSKAKTDSVFALIKVRDISQGANIVINKTNPNNWVISSTGGGTGSADWGQIGGDIADQSDLLDSLNSRLSLAVFDPVYNTLSGEQLLRYNDVTGKWENFSPSWILPGSNISLLNNNAGYAVIGSGAAQVRSNSDLDIRYVQSEVDPTVPQHVKDIATVDITNWNNKLDNITAGTGVIIDRTNPLNPIISADIGDGGRVLLDSIQDIPAGSILGLPGYSSNPWTETGQTVPAGIVNVWNAGTSYSTNSKVRIGRSLYVALSSNNNTPPATNPGVWSLRSSNFYGNWDKSVYYPLNAEVSSVNAGPIYRATSGVGGVEPWGASSSDTPAPPIPMSIGPNLSLSQDGVLSASFSNPDINGLIVAGSNVTITGQGTYTNPYVLNSTGGGGSGSTSVTGGTNITVTGAGTSGSPYVVNNTYNYNLPVASASTLGGVRVGSGLSISGGVLSVTGGGGGGSFQLRSGTNPYLTGQTTLLAGAGIQLTQSGSNITVTNTGGGGGGGISALTGDVLASGSGSVSATIANGAVSNNKMANMAGQTIKGRFGSAGAPEDLHNFAVRRIINPVFAISGTTINLQNGSKQYATRSTSTTYTMQEFYAGLELQVEISNSSGGAITISFDGATFPDGVNGSIPAGKTAVFSMTKFNTIIRATKVIF